MASTEEGRALTEAHRLAQIRVGAEAQAEARLLWDLLDVEDIDGSRTRWLASMEVMLQRGGAESADLAERYVLRHALAEIGEEIPVAHPTLQTARALRDVEILGPVSIKQRIASGVDPAIAHAAALTRVRQTAMKYVLNAGRDLTNDTVRYSGRRGRWRRVTGGEPCAFCAMLAGRGPVYAEDTVTFRAHGACGCASEIVYGDWEPNELEAAWRASYMQAAMDVDDEGGLRVAPSPGSDHEDNILWRMRRNSPGLFSDGVA